MTRKIRILALIGLFSILSVKGFSQLSISYYSTSLSKIGLAYNFNDRLWSELRLYNNTALEDISIRPELVICYNILKKERYNVYVGLGGILDYFEEFVLPVGVQFTPLEKFDSFSLHIEFLPTLDIDGYMFIQSSWGLRFRFGNKEP